MEFGTPGACVLFFAVAKAVDDVQAKFSSRTPFWVEKKKKNVEIRRNVRGGCVRCPNRST